MSKESPYFFKTWQYYLIAFLCLLNILIMNNITSLWLISEMDIVLQSLCNLEKGIPKLVMYLYLPFGKLGNDLFFLRLPSVLLFLASFYIIYYLGKKLFGYQSITICLIILSSSLLLPSLSKFAFADILLFTCQLLSFFTLLLFVKQPILKWKILYLISTLLSLIIHLPSAIIFSVVLFVSILILHQKGENLKKPIFLLPYILAFAFYLLADATILQPQGFYLAPFGNINYMQWLSYQIIGIIVWLPFIIAAIKHNYLKWKNREELSIILLVGLWASLASWSLCLQFILALAASKQLQASIEQHYPYQKWLKVGALLKIFFIFLVLFLFMLHAHAAFGMVGFRAAMPTALLMWGVSFIAVLGIFARNLRLIYVATPLGTLLAMLAFWVYWFPLVEGQMNVYQRLASDAGGKYIMIENDASSGVSYYNCQAKASSDTVVYVETKALPPQNQTKAVQGWRTWRDTVAYYKVDKIKN